MTRPIQYNSNVNEAIEQMQHVLVDMREHRGLHPNELRDIDADTAFELGYESALHDLKRFTGPDPIDLGIIVYTPIEGASDDQ